MGKAFWIRLILMLIAEWLKEQSVDTNTAQGILVNNLIEATSVEDLRNIAEDDTTVKAVEEIAVEVAKQPLFNVLNFALGWMFKK